MWEEGKYLAIDTRFMDESAIPGLKIIMENYCAEKNKTLLLDNMEGLIEKGYITVVKDSDMPESFTDGGLVYFDSITTDTGTLTMEGCIWYGNLGAEGATYTLSKKNGSWEMSEATDMWIS
jgi:hypothetical protein